MSFSSPHTAEKRSVAKNKGPAKQSAFGASAVVPAAGILSNFKSSLSQTVASIGDAPPLLPVSLATLQEWDSSKVLDTTVALRISQQRLLSLLSAKVVPGVSALEIPKYILMLCQVIGRDLFHVHRRDDAQKIYYHMITYIEAMRESTKDKSKWQSFLIEARMHLARSLIFDYDRLHHDPAEQDAARETQRALAAALSSVRVVLDNLRLLADDKTPIQDVLDLMRVLDTMASMCARLDKLRQLEEMYGAYRKLLNKCFLPAVQRNRFLVANDLALLSLQFLSLISNKCLASRRLPAAKLTIFNQELNLLHQLQQADEAQPEAQRSLQPATVRFIMIMNSMRAYLSDDLGRAYVELDEVRKFDEQHSSSSLMDPTYTTYRATILYAFLTDEVNGTKDWEMTRRDVLLDQVIIMLSKVVTLDAQLKCLTPGNTVLAKLAHCHAMRDVLNADPKSRFSAIKETEDYDYLDSAWQSTACSSLSAIARVTADLRKTIQNLITDQCYAEAVTLTQNVFGIGNASVLHKYDDLHAEQWDASGAVGITRPCRTPRVGPGQFEQLIFTIDERTVSADSLTDVLLAITLAHEDTHRRQYWHQGYVDLKAAKTGLIDATDSLSEQDYSRLVALWNNEVAFHEAGAYYAEIDNIQRCRTHFSLSRDEHEILERLQEESRTNAQEHFDRVLGLFPADHAARTFSLPDVSSLQACERMLSEIRELAALDDSLRRYIVEGHASSMYSTFQTDNATIFSANTSVVSDEDAEAKSSEYS